jgi:hypothetical protein
MASLGSTVSTRADTAARHMQACRVNYEHLSMMNGKPESEFLNNKFKYCMHKDELAVSLSKPMFAADAMQSSQKYPYPSVVTTLGEVDSVVKNFICWSNHISSDPAYDTLIDTVKNGRTITDENRTRVSNLKEYLPVGYSVGLAYAHASSGDNVASVMIGGVVTIPNGHFPMATGDMVQFYWDFEFDMFEAGGARRTDAALDVWDAARALTNPVAVDKSNDSKRQRFQDKRQNGMNKDTRKCNIPMIKPYVRHKGKQVYADNNRVFAKCISCARAFDMVDIMICRQAM